MATKEMEMEKWTCEQTAEWARVHYDEDVVKHFEGVHTDMRSCIFDMLVA